MYEPEMSAAYRRPPRGNLIEMAFFGIDGKPAVNKWQVSRWTKAYNTKSQVVLQSYFGLDGKPKANSEGCAQKKTAYDDQGQKVKTECLALDGSVVKEL